MNNSKLKSFRITKLVLALSLVGLLGAIAGYVYLFHIIDLVGNASASLQADTAELSAKESQVGELKKSLADNQAKDPILTSYFIDANDIVPFLETIEGYGKETNILVKFTTVNIAESPDRLVVDFTGDGNFSDLYRFLALVEAAPYEFTIDTATVQLSGNDPDDGSVDTKTPTAKNWEANMQISVLSITGVQHTAAPATASQ